VSNPEWLLSNAFKTYRHEEIKVGATFFKNILTNPHNTEYLRGAADMLRTIIKIPMELAQSKGQKDVALAMVEKAFKEVEMVVLRSAVLGDE
jgi:hypothetical protein